MPMFAPEEARKPRAAPKSKASPRRPPVRPATAAVMEKRIKAVVGCLPMSENDLVAQAILCSDDVAVFNEVFARLRREGVVIDDPEPGWIALAPEVEGDDQGDASDVADVAEYEQPF